MRLHHIGYLVKKIEKSIRAFQTLGFEPISFCGQPDKAFVHDPYRLCEIAFLALKTDDTAKAQNVIELIAPDSEQSPIWGLMSKYKNTPYHLCFESDDLEADIQTLRESGWMIFQPAATAPAIDGKPVVFLVHPSAGIIELVGEK